MQVEDMTGLHMQGRDFVPREVVTLNVTRHMLIDEMGWLPVIEKGELVDLINESHYLQLRIGLLAQPNVTGESASEQG